jgi:flagellar biosynthesis/type III secretory pathway chaperone
MGNHNTEKIMNLLNSWEKLVNLQSGAISDGDIHKLGELIDQSSSILKTLESLFLPTGSMKHDKTTLEIMKNLYEQQDKNIHILQEQIDILKQEVGDLRKNKSCIKGYTQKTTLQAYFKNERM